MKRVGRGREENPRATVAEIEEDIETRGRKRRVIEREERCLRREGKK